MKERPILFNTPMVRATLNGSKGQTRRVMKPEPMMVSNTKILPWEGDASALMRLLEQSGRSCPYGQPGDRLWVRETWAYHVQAIGAVCDEDGPFVYAADTFGKQYRLCEKWTPSIHMPRWASRILLEITAVRVERLQDISEADAKAEGCAPSQWSCTPGLEQYSRAYREGFRVLWESINGPDSWNANPWVWVVEFKRVQS